MWKNGDRYTYRRESEREKREREREGLREEIRLIGIVIECNIQSIRGIDSYVEKGRQEIERCIDRGNDRKSERGKQMEIRGIYRNTDKQRHAQRRWRHGLTEEMIERVREENRWIFSNTDEQKDYDNDRE